ncbi:hypothetical protein ACI3KX_12945 [Microbacterium sp. ZW CA_36]|uniref:hypothetical protein n=1 Tax=Microbacterium sp. ZW CA_36 TaxID=3378078 RepID=UPI0038521BFC
MTGLTGSALRKTERVVAAQGFDARTFAGGRTLRLVLPVSNRGRTGYKQLFIANLVGRSATDAYLVAGLPSALLVDDCPFDAPPQVGPARVSARHIRMTDESEALEYLALAVDSRLVVSLDNLEAPPAYPGPFSVATQDVAAGLQPSLGVTLFGARLLCARPAAVVEEVYSVMATSREEAAAIVLRQAIERTDCGAQMSIEVEDTHFDRAYDNNTLLILEHRSALAIADFMRQQRLAD